MPIYVYRCQNCKNVIERIHSYKAREEFKVKNICSLCEGDFESVTTMPAKTPGLWGDETGKHGADGFFSKSLGKHVTSKHEEERIANKMGYVNYKDVETEVARKVSAKIDEDKHFDKLNDAYQARVKEGGNTYGAAIRAVEELLPAKEMLAQADKLENS